MRWWFLGDDSAGSGSIGHMDEDANGEQWECPPHQQCCRVYAEPGNDGIDTETRCFIIH